MDKKQLREIAKKKRAEIIVGDKPQKLADNFFKNVKLQGDEIIAVYHPVNSEADIFPIIKRLKNICLPVIKGESLEFRVWNLGDELVKNKFGIPEPQGKILIPQIIIVPCLAFNKEKYRLGYGGGFYDKTLHSLKAKTIGIAYAEQEMDFTPETHDIKLDLIVTESKLYS